MGFYIVKPQYRGRGFGLQLWDAAMAYLGGRNVGLDGVIAQQGNYRESGFKLAYRNIRHQGKGGGAPSGLLDLSSVAFDEIARYDGTVFPAARPSFLHRWIRQPQGVAFGVRGKREDLRDTACCARVAGVSRSGRSLPTIRTAGTLFQGLASRVPGQLVFLDTSEANPAAIELAKRQGMESVFETARMYSKGFPPGRIDRCVGVTSLVKRLRRDRALARLRRSKIG